jgi:opacity protein-like surface antigen
MSSRSLVLMGVLLAAMPSTATAQRRWDIALQGGAAFPTMDLFDTDLDVGFGFEGTVSYRFLSSVAVYAGWDWHRFTTDTEGPSFIGEDVDVEETGYVLGLRYQHELGEANSPAVMLRGGVTLNHIELEDEAGDLESDSGHGLGYEVGAGFSLPLGERVRLGLEGRYRSLDRDLTVDSITLPVTLAYATAELGLRWSF